TLILGLLGAAMLLPLALTGFTPGKRLMGLRVAPVHDANGPDSRLGVLTVLRRSALPAAAAVMFIGGDLVVPTQVAGAVGLGLVLFHVLGQLALFFDAPVYRTWHDRLAHTVVVEWRPEWAPPLGRASGSPVD
ncbi:MAG: RDD family protein, partial [Micrococcus sp.]|nr:RDD family protein [Micrococcus sp.]